MVAVTPENRVATVDKLMRLAAECFCAPRIVFTPEFNRQLPHARSTSQLLTNPDENWYESLNMLKTAPNADRKVVYISPYGRALNIVCKESVKNTMN